jgi:membrane protein DedA with SNARE-associated domain
MSLFQGEVPHLLSTYGYAAVAGVVALESMGIPLPGETTLIAAALVAGTTHDLNVWLVIAAAAGGAILGDNVGFWIGREFGFRLLVRYGRYVGLTDRRIKLGQFLFLHHGGKVVFFGRFVAVLRALAAVLAGANCMPWRSFLFFNASGGIVWALFYGLGAYYLGEKIEQFASPIAIAIGLLVAAGVVVSAIFIKRHEAELEARAEQAFPGPIRRRTFR